MNAGVACRIVVGLIAVQLVTTAWADPLLTPLAGASAEPPAPWHVVGLPRQTKPFTRFSVVDLGGRRALRIEADASYGNLVHPLKSLQLPMHLAWQWRIERPLSRADLRQKSGDDSAVRVCVFFDEPMKAIPFGDRQVLRFARSRSAEPVPSATLCYVWDATLPVGTAIDNAFTRRQRYIVVESGGTPSTHWVAERRDLSDDFMRVFGDEVARVPPIVGIAVGADADNTKDHSIAYVSDLSLEP